MRVPACVRNKAIETHLSCKIKKREAALRAEEERFLAGCDENNMLLDVARKIKMIIL